MGTGSTVPSHGRVDGAACPRAKLLLVNADDLLCPWVRGPIGPILLHRTLRHRP